jgi:hypothetical protein
MCCINGASQFKAEGSTGKQRASEEIGYKGSLTAVLTTQPKSSSQEPAQRAYDTLERAGTYEAKPGPTAIDHLPTQHGEHSRRARQLRPSN